MKNKTKIYIINIKTIVLNEIYENKSTKQAMNCYIATDIEVSLVLKSVEHL